eukprot:s1145_g10.t1
MFEISDLSDWTPVCSAFCGISIKRCLWLLLKLRQPRIGWDRNQTQLNLSSIPAMLHPVPLEKLSDQEAAKVFVSMLFRRGQDRLLNGLSKEQAVELLQEEKLLRNCKGQLTEVLSVVDEVISAQIPLFERPP